MTAADGENAIAADVPHLLHVWREAKRAALASRQVAQLAHAAARQSDLAADAAQAAALAAEQALLMAGVTIPERIESPSGLIAPSARGAAPEAY